jgi:formate-dependent nitrite reductase cytochrome c552 subunit
MLPMKQDTQHDELTCSSCHGAHRFDVITAAVESCLGCHDDDHSLAYQQSPHYRLWLKEVSGEAEAGSGVSCASCHMPRISYDVSEWSSRIIVDHNQSANLSPNSKMIRSSCLNCHGLAFTLEALTDENMINNNFTGKPVKYTNTMDLANRENQRRLKAAAEDEDAGMFGF